jgi:hypothetical protein
VEGSPYFRVCQNNLPSFRVRLDTSHFSGFDKRYPKIPRFPPTATVKPFHCEANVVAQCHWFFLTFLVVQPTERGSVGPAVIMSSTHPCEIQNKRIVPFKKVKWSFIILITHNSSTTDVR